ncbi:MAG: copper amine oxidase N-terminal domain-containing protein [Syntrophomonadaceae bacterium]|nr:copper amine oxidase N-terminal domain-containing protein [Syntrophomonadaceae bacterium]
MIVVGSGVYTGAIDIGGNEVIPVQYRGVSFSSNGMITLIASDSADLTIRNPICADRKINIFITNAPLQPFPVVGPADGSKEPYLGTQWIYTDQEPFVENGRTMVPLRAVEDISGHTLQWNEADRSVILRGYNNIISLKVDSYEAGINTFDDKQAKRTVILDVAPKIINGRTFVPLRFIAEATGAKVDWDPVTNSVLIENDYE